MLLVSILSWFMWRAWRNVQYALLDIRARDKEKEFRGERRQPRSLYGSLAYYLKEAQRELGLRQTRRTIFALLLGRKTAEEDDEASTRLPLATAIHRRGPRSEEMP